MLKAGKDKHSFVFLEPPQSFGSITAADVYNAGSAKDHKTVVREWAQTTWEAWSVHHDTIREWLPNNALHQTSR
jgi:hypothetical protein